MVKIDNSGPKKGIRRTIVKGKNGNDEIDKQIDANRYAFRTQLIKEFLSKEREKLEAIKQTLNVLTMVAKELEKNELMDNAVSRLTEFVNFKQNLLKKLEEQARRTLDEQKIGKLFLEFAPELRLNLRSFCEKHCDLVELLNQKSGQIQMHLTKANTNLKDLVLGLSFVFRHIQKYAAILQEIEQNTQDECETIRRQREAQLDFMRTGVLEQNIGMDYKRKLGTLLYIGKVVAIVYEESNEKMSERDELVELDRCIAVFSQAILLLDVQITTGQYSLKNFYINAELIVRQPDFTNHSLQIFKGNELLMILKCVGKREFGQFFDAIRQSVHFIEVATDENVICSEKEAIVEKIRLRNCTSPVKLRQQNNDMPSSICGNIRLDHHLEMVLPDGFTIQSPQHSSLSRISSERFSLNNVHSISSPIKKSASEKSPYSGWTLRPIPPHRGEWLPGSANDTNVQQQIKLRKGLTSEEQEDAQLLKIIEDYCLANNFAVSGCGSASMNVQCCGHHYRQRMQQQRNSADSCTSPCGGGPVRRAASYPDHHEMASKPQLIVAEDEKLFVEEMEGDEIVVKERSLVDTIYSLKDQLIIVMKEVNKISKTLEHEQRARRRMEEYIRQTSGDFTSSLANPIIISSTTSTDVNTSADMTKP